MDRTERFMELVTTLAVAEKQTLDLVVMQPELTAAAETIRHANDLVDMAWELDEGPTFRGSLLDQHMPEN